MGVRISSKGNWNKTRSYLKALKKKKYYEILSYYGDQGVMALSSATPRRTGKTAESWSYTIEQGKGNTKIVWTNSSLTSQGDSIALLLQYGHGTGTGGYVVGIDYINPAIKPIFDDIAEKVWEELSKL